METVKNVKLEDVTPLPSEERVVGTCLIPWNDELATPLPRCRKCDKEIDNYAIIEFHKARVAFEWSDGLGYLCENCGGAEEGVCAKCLVSIPHDDESVRGGGDDGIATFALCKSCHDAMGCDGNDHYQGFCPKFSDVEFAKECDERKHARTCRVCGDTYGDRSETGGWDEDNICMECWNIGECSV